MNFRCISSFGVVAVALCSGPCLAETCKDLAALKLPDTKIISAEVVDAGSFEAPMPPPFPPARSELPARCRVVGSIHPTQDSQIGFEVWMPVSGWNGRYQQVGNGGLAGHIEYFGLVSALLHGSATAATDDGHVSASAFDGDWAIGHPQRLVDYGYRAVHLTALTGAALVRRYYGRKESHSYFLGCSDGGRESLMEAQRYPEDFDGYLVGAPGIDIANGAISHLHTYRTLRALGPGDQLTPQQLKALSAKVLERCDALDGVKDGALRDPRRCAFKSDEMLCSSGTGASCLTPAQANAVEQIYAGPRDPATGAQLAHGNVGTLGTEDRTWPRILTDGPQVRTLGSAVSVGAISALVYGNPQLDLITADLAQATRDAEAKLGSIMNPTNPDLARARTLGKKILHFHGWADPNIPPQYSIEYFEAVKKRMGADTSGFYRLFMVPGMPHCGGSPGLGPNFVGFTGGFTGGLAVPQLTDADHNWTDALERWVEKGIAPDHLIATEFAVEETGAAPAPILPATPVRSTRPICPYPQVASYANRGPTTVAASFDCKSP